MIKKNKKVVIIGGTGFVGLFLTENLLKDGFEILLILRKSSLKKIKFLRQKYPKLLKIKILNFSKLSYKTKINFSKYDCLIYLIGILFENQTLSFKTAHFTWPKIFIQLCHQFSINHFIYFSSISSIPCISKQYIITKQLAENLIQHSNINYTILKPPLIYKNGTFLFKIANFIFHFSYYIPFYGKKIHSFNPISIKKMYSIVKYRILNNSPKNISLETKDFHQFDFS